MIVSWPIEEYPIIVNSEEAAILERAAPIIACLEDETEIYYTMASLLDDVEHIERGEKYDKMVAEREVAKRKLTQKEI